MSFFESREPRILEMIQEIVISLFRYNESVPPAKRLTQKAIGGIVHRSQPEISAYYKLYQQGRDFFKPGPQPHETPLTQEIVQVIKEADDAGKSLSINQVVQRLNTMSNLPHLPCHNAASTSYIYRVARDHGYSSVLIKHVTKVNDEKTNRRRAEMASAVVQELALHPRTYVTFVDEMSLNTRDAGKGARGFSKIGEDARNDDVNILTFFSKSVSATIFASQNQIEYVHVQADNVKATDFDFALREYLEHRPNNEHIVLLLDNAAIHRLHDLNNVQEEYANFSFAFLPVNSPDANAVESIISIVRKHIVDFLMQTTSTDPKEVWQSVINYLKTLRIPFNTCKAAGEMALRVIGNLQTMSYAEAVERAKKRRQ